MNNNMLQVLDHCPFSPSSEYCCMSYPTPLSILSCLPLHCHYSVKVFKKCLKNLKNGDRGMLRTWLVWVEVHLVDLYTVSVTNPSFLSISCLLSATPRLVFSPLPHQRCLQATERCPTGTSTDRKRNAQRNALLLCAPFSAPCVNE